MQLRLKVGIPAKNDLTYPLSYDIFNRMKIYKYPKSTNIDTGPENVLVIGQKYDYKEGGIVGECEFIADESDDEFYKWHFKWTIHPFTDNDTTEFVCSETKRQQFYYSGMWHIYPQWTYMFPKRPFSPHTQKLVVNSTPKE